MRKLFQEGNAKMKKDELQKIAGAVESAGYQILSFDESREILRGSSKPVYKTGVITLVIAPEDSDHLPDK
jgi:hypothetical protein